MNVQAGAAGWLFDEAIAPNAKLKQGDFVVFDRAESELRRAGIIVTADCDLQQKKHARLVTLIPVVTTKIILEHYLIMEDCERKLSMILDYALKELGIDKRHDHETKLSLIRMWADSDVGGIHTLIGIAASFILDRCESISVEDYKSLMKAVGSSPRKPDALRDQIRSRGDLLILPDTHELGIVGGIAWIRHIWQAQVTDIAIRTSETSARPGERIARLDSPYRYRLTQLMAQVFSDIGLPDNPDSMDQLLEDAYQNV